ncbi:MAG: hypothetical protein V4664_03080 [Patescibacteria group bacterium]
MKIDFNNVTWYSKLASALVLLGAVPILVFFIGREYQKTMAIYDSENEAAVKSYSSADRAYSRRESYSPPVLYKSGIKGVAMVGPTCPVMKEGSEEECSDKPLVTTIKFLNQYGSVMIATSSKDGSFSIMLAPGNYTVVAGGEGILPALSPQKVVVEEDQYTNVVLSFDSGIR